MARIPLELPLPCFRADLSGAAAAAVRTALTAKSRSERLLRSAPDGDWDGARSALALSARSVAGNEDDGNDKDDDDDDDDDDACPRTEAASESECEEADDRMPAADFLPPLTGADFSRSVDDDDDDEADADDEAERR